jgi:hypothetical protein
VFVLLVNLGIVAFLIHHIRSKNEPVR